MNFLWYDNVKCRIIELVHWQYYHDSAAASAAAIFAVIIPRAVHTNMLTYTFHFQNQSKEQISTMFNAEYTEFNHSVIDRLHKKQSIHH